MHIFIAGATGAAGRTLIPMLIADGHTVTGTTRSEAKAPALRALGARPAVMDGLDRPAVLAAVRAAKPDVIVHQMTALGGADFRRFARSFAQTNRLRTEGTEHLLEAAARTTGARVIAQSFAGWPSERTGGPVKTEADPLDPDPPRAMREAHAAIRRLEALVTGAGGIALRYGGFYGPGTGLTAGGEQVELLLRRRFPVIGSGDGVWSFAHTDDVASATLAAIQAGRPGEIYNVCDDEPAPVREWLPHLARCVGAPAPRTIPVWLARVAAGPAAVAMMTSSRGASNAKARAELGWEPRHASWREGFATLVRPRSRAPRPAARSAR
jgi:nucleoside-diphosphate-sugar epimerase